MSSFTAPLRVEITQARRCGRTLADLLDRFSYEVGALGSGDVITVPAGYETDFISIPRLLWAFENPLGDAAKAAVLHDWLYTTAARSRAEADAIFLEAMGVLRVGFVKRHLLYLAVRLFGWRSYGRADPPGIARSLQPD